MSSLSPNAEPLIIVSPPTDSESEISEQSTVPSSNNSPQYLRVPKKSKKDRMVISHVKESCTLGLERHDLEALLGKEEVASETEDAEAIPARMWRERIHFIFWVVVVFALGYIMGKVVDYFAAWNAHSTREKRVEEVVGRLVEVLTAGKKGEMHEAWLESAREMCIGR